MSAGHHHSHHHHTGTDGNERRLLIVLGLTAGFMVLEAVGGVVTQSLALISDAAHMLTDVAALAISLAAIRIGKRVADRKRTYGYYRFEILAAAFNAVVLFFVAGFVLIQAYHRFFQPPNIHTTGMLAIATAGLAVNVIGMALLRAGSDSSLNVKGAYLEVWSDALGSVGVIAAALIIRATDWTWVDPLVAVAIGFWILPRTWVLLKESINILLEGVPQGLTLDEIEQSLLAVPGVASLHDLHVWALSSGKNSLTAHLVMHEGVSDSADVLRAATRVLSARFGITHTTLQVEEESCGRHHGDAHFSHDGHGHRHT